MNDGRTVQMSQAYDLTVADDVRDWEIVISYLRLGSSVKVARSLRVSRQTVRNACVRFSELMERSKREKSLL